MFVPSNILVYFGVSGARSRKHVLTQIVLMLALVISMCKLVSFDPVCLPVVFVSETISQTVYMSSHVAITCFISLFCNIACKLKELLLAS